MAQHSKVLWYVVAFLQLLRNDLRGCVINCTCSQSCMLLAIISAYLQLIFKGFVVDERS